METETLGNLIALGFIFVIFLALAVFIFILIRDTDKEDYKYCYDCKYLSCDATPKCDKCLKYQDKIAEKEAKKQKKSA